MANIPQKPAPFLSTESIVDRLGLPTDYFLRQWSQQQDVNEANEELVNDVTALQALELIAGTGLSGGGNLTADRTFNIANTAVTAGSYGAATKSLSVTVNAQGQLTAVSENTITAGAGSDSFVWPVEMDEDVNTIATAFKGCLINPFVDITISSIAAHMTLLNGSDYIAGVYRLDGSDAIDQITAESSTFTAPGAASYAITVFDVNASLVADSRYAVMVGRTDGSSTYILPLSNEAVISGDNLHYPSMPLIPFDTSGIYASTRMSLASTGPSISDSVTMQATNFAYGIGLFYSID